MNKKTIALLFGGQSSEHDVSKLSAATVISNMNSEKYYILPVYITREGKWLLYDGPVENINTNGWEKYATNCVLSPDTSHKGLLRIVGEKVKFIPVDLVFPVLHGAYGEDGTIQGLLELAKIPYVGCGVLASGLAMNKKYTKIVVDTLGINQAKSTVVYSKELENEIETCIERVENVCGYPCFIKPACAGSSVGVTKAEDRDQLVDGLWIAAKEDSTIIVERNIDGRELECGVLGNDELQISVVGEILSDANANFYSYDAKYKSKESKTVLPADIPEEKSEEIRRYAGEIYKALGCKGLSRVDFFLENGTNKVIFNEINTLPGFTSISMYPMLFNEAGYTTEELVDKLIELGLTRYEN